MNVTLSPSTLCGAIKAPPSKSILHRLLIAASISDAPVCIKNVAHSGDIDATISCLSSMGAEIAINGGNAIVSPIKKIKNTACALDCGESASTLRFILPLAAALGLTVSVSAAQSLISRPIDELLALLHEHAYTMIPSLAQSRSPFVMSGKLTAGTYHVSADITSQYATGLLMALPLLCDESEIRLKTALSSKPYVDMTLYILRRFRITIYETETGYYIPARQRYISPRLIEAEGDWSNAAVFLCAGALSKAVTVSGLSSISPQGDKAILDILSMFGADVSMSQNRVSVSPRRLSGITLSADAVPDLVPVICVVAATAKGKTIIHNVSRLRFKESDRPHSITTCLNTLGADITEKEDSIEITGVRKLKGGTVSAYNDHRIAMAMALASVISEGDIIITGASATDKSYPDFFKDFSSLGGIIA